MRRQDTTDARSHSDRVSASINKLRAEQEWPVRGRGRGAREIKELAAEVARMS